ncbi:MAG: hypothetical protein MR792_04755 [Paraprevotella sp.]|nr:hypothetical protein [Paraprevotella sp.]
MKTYRFYIMTLALTFLFAGCSEDELTKGPGAQVGDEVQFGLSLSNLDTRTVYGDETSTGFPIYWVNGDKVRVASPQCLSGRNSAEYEIAVANPNQNYATSMTKTGDAGVQWGNAETADFYSIYPSSASTSLEVSGEGVTTTLHVDATQFASISTKKNGTSDYFYAQPAEMGNVVMYAKTAGAESGKPVELHYTPFSTVLEFEINASNEVVAGKQTKITIQSLTLTAPSGTSIAGDFGFTFPTGESTTPTIEAATGGSNSIIMHLLENNQYTAVLSPTKTTLKAKMCLMPISGNLAGWKIEVKTSAGTFSKTLAATDSKNKPTTLAPGKVHKITLPTLSYASQEWVYSLNNWIPSLPDYTNIYLSELSLPGAWYTGSTETYQANSDVPTLWDKGVRAFAVECRSYSTGRYNAPSRICISGSGGQDGDAYSDYDGVVGIGSHDAIHISTIIKDICDKLASQTDVSKQEYAVLVLSYADGGEGGHRDVDHDYFLNGIDNEITKSGVEGKYIFGNNGETLSKNTTVDDVKGKLIIKVNMDYDTYGTRSGTYKSGITSRKSYSYTYGNNLNSAISYTPFLKTVGSDNYAHPCYSNMYWKEWLDEYKQFGLVSQLNGKENGDRFIWVFSSANRTHADVTDGSTYDIPTYADRKEALGAMMKYSTQIYKASTHNVWFYFNCGGTQATSSTSKNPSPTDFAKTMNSWLLETINAKTDASPLGIVMFNQCTNADYNGPAIIKAIIEMNSKFYLKHADTQTPVFTSAAPGYSAGMKNSKTDAISPGTGKN